MILLIIELISLFVLYMLSKNKYNNIIARLDKKEYPLKDLLPIGLFVMDAINYKYKHRYDQWLKQKLSNIYTTTKDNYYLRIHLGNKLTYMLVLLLIICLFGVGMGEITHTFIAIMVILFISVFYAIDRELDKKIEARARSIRLDIPSFMNNIALLLNAGMTFNKAWEKIVLDNKDNKRPLYKELEYTYYRIKAGESYNVAYEDFSRRCKLPEITKFISLVLQNLKRGNEQLSVLIRILGTECWQLRKNTAKKLGEEASSKLLLPMMLMFVGILIIMLLPAALQFQNI
ncbi:type II secretion system F family protein [Clostridiaceae bacterium M8S5]|nr:type II secretion system F family protein [Clostridiaceae bacterium M8S5]